MSGARSAPASAASDPAIAKMRLVVRVASIYLRNGSPVGTDKYPYKLKWMDRLISYARERMRLEEPLVEDREAKDVAEVLDAPRVPGLLALARALVDLQGVELAAVGLTELPDGPVPPFRLVRHVRG